MFIELTNRDTRKPVCINFDHVFCFEQLGEGTKVHNDDGCWHVIEPVDYIHSMLDGRRRCSPVGEMHQAAYDIVHDIVTRHGITSPNQFTCRHIAKLAELVGYFPTRS